MQIPIVCNDLHGTKSLVVDAVQGRPFVKNDAGGSASMATKAYQGEHDLAQHDQTGGRPRTFFSVLNEAKVCEFTHLRISISIQV